MNSEHRATATAAWQAYNAMESAFGPSFLTCVATTSLCHFLVLHRNLATALADVR